MAQMITVRRAASTNIVIHLRGKPANGTNRTIRGIYVIGDPNRLPASLTVQIPMQELVGNDLLAGDLQRYLDAGFITVEGPDGAPVTGVTDFLTAPPQVYADATRPTPAKFFRGQFIYNTDDNAPNFADGAGAWRSAAGVVT
jgi:hypothetical protein